MGFYNENEFGGLRMKNKFFVTSYGRMMNFEYIYGMIVSNLKQLADSRGWMDVKYPIRFEIEEEHKEITKKGWFGKERKVTKTRYFLFFVFDKELDEKDLMFWRGFALGNWRNY